jgi:hypothetical protein
MVSVLPTTTSRIQFRSSATPLPEIQVVSEKLDPDALLRFPQGKFQAQ